MFEKISDLKTKYWSVYFFVKRQIDAIDELGADRERNNCMTLQILRLGTDYFNREDVRLKKLYKKWYLPGCIYKKRLKLSRDFSVLVNSYAHNQIQY